MRIETRAWIGRVLAVAIVVIAVVVVNAQQQKAPFPAYFIEVEIGGITTHFRSVSGLKIETEVVEYQEGGSNGPIRKLPGVTRYGNIRLSRALTADRSLYKWFVAQKQNAARVDGLIALVDRQGTRVASWTFTNGFPVKWELSELDAAKSEVVIETIEIAHEGLTSSNDED